MIIAGDPAETVVDDDVTFVKELTVHVPPVTERTVVGFDPDVPLRERVTIVCEFTGAYPTFTGALETAAEDEPTENAAASPVPVSVTSEGVPTVLSAKLNVAVLEPTSEGVNVNAMVQVPFTAMLCPEQLSVPKVKSLAFVPLFTIAGSTRGASPVFLIVTVCNGDELPTMVGGIIVVVEVEIGAGV